jgi:hypothetical protein
MNKEKPKLSEMVKNDFEKCRKDCLELWYSTIEKHTKAKPNLSDNKNYIAIANSYKPFEEHNKNA